MKKIIIKLIDKYQESTVDSIKRCRYYPTCSNYCKEAFLKRNIFVASFLSAYRIIRCNPFSKGGYDPVPLSRKEKKNESKN